jgi:hypothetical protein
MVSVVPDGARVSSWFGSRFVSRISAVGFGRNDLYMNIVGIPIISSDMSMWLTDIFPAFMNAMFVTENIISAMATVMTLQIGAGFPKLNCIPMGIITIMQMNPINIDVASSMRKVVKESICWLLFLGGLVFGTGSSSLSL